MENVAVLFTTIYKKVVTNYSLDMRISKEQALMLGLTSREVHILEVLHTQPQHLSALAKILQQPRSTIEYTVKSLRKRGWVSSRRVGAVREWSVMPNKRFVDVLNDLSQQNQKEHLFQFACSQFGEVLHITPALGIGYHVHTGVAAMQHLLSQLPNARQKQVWGIATDRSCQQALQKLDPVALADTNYAFSTNKVITHSILTDNYFQTGFQVSGFEWLRSFDKRIETTYVLPDHFLPKNTHIQIVDDQVYFHNWEKEITLEICDPDIVALYHSLFTLWQGHGKRLVVRDHVRTLTKSD